MPPIPVVPPLSFMTAATPSNRGAPVETLLGFETACVLGSGTAALFAMGWFIGGRDRPRRPSARI
jgi:hypothetical protein